MTITKFERAVFGIIGIGLIMVLLSGFLIFLLSSPSFINTIIMLIQMEIW